MTGYSPDLPVRTLCFLVDGVPARRVLLGYKKAGFGQGKYTGFGGKVEPGENVAQAAAREMWEESCIRIDPAALTYTGRLTFLFPHQPGWSQVVQVYLAQKGVGEPGESDEMLPSWFTVHALPYDRMWQDGAYWLPLILSGQFVEACFVFQADNQSIEHVDLQTIDHVDL